jgi:hypothetical protein
MTYGTSKARSSPPCLRRNEPTEAAGLPRRNGSSSEVADGLARSGRRAAGRHEGMFIVTFDMAPE